MKKLLSVLLTFAMLMSLVAGSTFSTGAKSIDIAQINKAIPDAMLSYSIEDKIASLSARTYEVSEEPQAKYTDINGYIYGYVGDVDGDNDVTIFDATAIQMHIAQLELIMPTQQLLADIDADNAITIMDVTEVQLYAAQLSQSQRIFHLLYSPFGDFDPMLDTFDDIAKALKENGTYDNYTGFYTLGKTFDEGNGDTAYASVEYSENNQSITYHIATHVAAEDAHMVVDMIIHRGSKKFDFYSTCYTSQYTLYDAWGKSEFKNVTLDGFEFNTQFTRIDSEFGVTADDIIWGIDAMFPFDMIYCDEVMVEYIVGSTSDLVYDITKLYEFL